MTQTLFHFEDFESSKRTRDSGQGHALSKLFYFCLRLLNCFGRVKGNGSRVDETSLPQDVDVLAVRNFKIPCFRPETPPMYLRSLITNHEGCGRKLGFPRRLKGRDCKLPWFKMTRTSTSWETMALISSWISVVAFLSTIINWATSNEENFEIQIDLILVS